MYRGKARKDYLNLAKCKKRTAGKIRKAIKSQLQYMYDNKVHCVPDRIVSISQPYIRPIVRGKVKAPVEFGVKLDLSIDENGIARLERLSFDAYNESDVLISAVENYKHRTGHYPERILVDQILESHWRLQYVIERTFRRIYKRTAVGSGEKF